MHRFVIEHIRFTHLAVGIAPHRTNLWVVKESYRFFCAHKRLLYVICIISANGKIHFGKIRYKVTKNF